MGGVTQTKLAEFDSWRGGVLIPNLIYKAGGACPLHSRINRHTHTHTHTRASGAYKLALITRAIALQGLLIIIFALNQTMTQSHITDLAPDSLIRDQQRQAALRL